jgi:proline dehydrogenase
LLARDFILWLSTKPSVTNTIARRGMKNGFARRFIAGETLDEVLGACAALCAQGRTVSLNHLGENVSTEAAANKVFDTYVHLLEQVHARNLPGNISIKLTQLGLVVGRGFCENLTRNIASRARELHRTIEIDMEASAYTEVTLEIFEAVQRASGNVALAIQAYLYRSENDLKRLELLRPKIRLVKGAYREPKDVAFQEKSAVDANFKRLTTQLMEGAARGTFFPAIGSHDPAMAAHAQAEAGRLQVPNDKYEFQMLYGIRRDLQDQVFCQGSRVQVYVSFGTDWCPWFMRRLAERPANCWFVLRSLLAERKT